MLEKIVDIVKNVTELNLRYTSTLLYLGKDYVKDINTLVTTTTRSNRPPGGDAQPTRTPPLLIVGTLGENATAAFPLKNSSGRDVNVSFVVQGELDSGQVQVEPQSLAIKAGETAIVRVIAHIDSKLEVGRDYAGAVAAPGLSAQFVEFIVRRLPAKSATSDSATSDASDASRVSANPEEPPEAAARSSRRRSTPREGSE